MKGSKGNIIIKLDLEKAFDCLEWSFIYRTLVYFKFPPKITNLIMNCITTSNIAILINGTSTNYFKPTRGIRQGDLFSPFIFVLCIEMLSRYINHQVDCAN